MEISSGARTVLAALSSSVIIAVLWVAPPSAATVPASPSSPATVMVSTDPSGMAAGNGRSDEVSISADGRFIAFSSIASNLTSTAHGGYTQVYVKDMVSGGIELVSTAASGGSAGAGDSSTPSISADGRYVAFVSRAKNLESRLDSSNPHSQVFLRDRVSRRTLLVSVDIGATDGAWGNSTSPALSGDGRTIAFQSAAVDLVPGVRPSEQQIFVASFGSEDLPRVKVASLQDGSRSPTPELANKDAIDPSISADGRIVTFSSTAVNLRTTPSPKPDGLQQGFVHDMVTGATGLVTVSADGSAGGDRSSQHLRISADGGYVVFASRATDLTSEREGLGSSNQIYVKSLTGSARPELVSAGRDGKPTLVDNSTPTISRDGRKITYVGFDELARVDVRSSMQTFVWSSATRATELVSAVANDPRQGSGESTSAPVVSADGGHVAFTSTGDGLTSTPNPTGAAQIHLRELPANRVDRIDGADRYDVSAGIGTDAFPPRLPVVYIASGQTFADALSGSAAAGASDGPVLLVSQDRIPPAVDAQLRRLKPASIVILGGLNSVSAAVESALSTLAPTVSRIGGADRYQVSAAVSAATFTSAAGVAYVASGEVFPDALAGSAAAGASGAPVLLATRTAVPDPVRAELTRLAPRSIVMLGGENTLAAPVLESLQQIAPVTRITGADRYEVSAAISRSTSSPEEAVVYVASGAVFADALSASAAAGADRAPVLLVRPNGIPAAVAAELSRLEPHRIVILGGSSTISDTMDAELLAYLHK